METLLIAVTLVSLVLALVMSVVAWRATRGEKERAGARVAALAVAADVAAIQPIEPAEPPIILPAAARIATAPWRNPAERLADMRDGGLDLATAPVPVDEPAAAVSPAGTVSVHSGFLGAEAPNRDSQRHQRWLQVAAAVIAVVLGTGVAVRMSHRGTTAQAVHAQAAPAPLELLSLRHERQGVNLSVAGLVRNPAVGSALERVTAVVYLFDQQGAFVTSAKAPIDFLKLTGGEESPFVVKVAAPTTVARYRVSFRTEDGTLAHVDRRGEPPATAPVALTRQ
jgi:hypothetical protein